MKYKKIYEPTTTLTDVVLTILGLGFGLSVLAQYQEKQFAFHFYWGWGFIWSGMGAFLGALSHGYGPYFNSKVQKILWKLTMFNIGVSGWLYAVGSSIFFFRNETYDAARWIFIVAFILYILWLLKDDRFLVVIIYYIPLMLFIMGGMLYQFVVLNSAGSLAVAMGILVSLAGAGIQASGFSIHKHFNHNDIFHVIQMIGYLLMYQGGMEIGLYP